MAAVVLACLIVAVPASASANCSSACTWTGQTSTGVSGDTDWSNAANWDVNGVPNGTVATPDTSLVFPDLDSFSSCTATPRSAACYDSDNNLLGIATDSLQVDIAKPYDITGNAISIGSSGITADTTDSSYYGGPVVAIPLTLTASQPWTISAGTASYFEPPIDLAGNITGPAANVTVSLEDASLGLVSSSSAVDDELGAVSVSAPTNDYGAIQLGGSGHGGSLNGTDGNPVSLTGSIDLGVGGASSIGPLSMSGTTLGLNGAATLSVNGAATFDSSSTLFANVTDTTSSPQAGADYSQLSASGNVALGGSSLQISAQSSGYPQTCDALPVGTVYTLVQAASVTGTFSNAPASGDDIQALCSSGTPATFQIDYNTSTSPTTVTAKVVDPTATVLTASSQSPTTNQGVTLTANVSPAPTSPTGTVDFTVNGNQISGCSAQPVDSNTGNATCQTSFTAGTQDLTATYNPASGSSYAGSSGSDTLTVGKDSTNATLSASNTSPSEGQDVTYTATVTPTHSGSSEPSGTIEFEDAGSPISGCTTQPLSAGTSSSTATCTTSYSSAGSHSITASYGGDANFDGSTTSAERVTVTAPPTPTNSSTPQNPSKPAPPAKSTHRHPLSLAVSPGSIRADAPACFEFIARSGGHAVTGALVTLAGHRAHTASHGRARICMKLRNGTYHPTASKRGFKPARTRVSVYPARIAPRFTG